MNPLLEEGLNLMAVGMGTVFTFLVLLVFITSAMSRLLNRFVPEEAAVRPVQAPQSSAQTSIDATTLAVITEAIKQHRER